MKEPGARRELRIHAVPTREERLRTIIEIAAILAAGLWAIYTFVYEQRIKPLSEAPSFAVPTDVHQGPTIDGVVFLTIHKGLQNTGNVPIDVAAEGLSVYGETIGHFTGTATKNVSRWRDEVSYDVPRHTDKLLYSYARLRSGALGGNPRTNFFVAPHSSAAEDYLVAVPVQRFPVIRVHRIDYIGKFPITPKIDVRIVSTPLHGYDLHSGDLAGEFDSDTEYAIKP